jgi:hypothetical protein
MNALPPSAVNDRFTGDRLMLWQMDAVSLSGTAVGLFGAAATTTEDQTAKNTNPAMVKRFIFTLILNISKELGPLAVAKK